MDWRGLVETTGSVGFNAVSVVTLSSPVQGMRVPPGPVVSLQSATHPGVLVTVIPSASPIPYSHSCMLSSLDGHYPFVLPRESPSSRVSHVLADSTQRGPALEEGRARQGGTVHLG